MPHESVRRAPRRPRASWRPLAAVTVLGLAACPAPIAHVDTVQSPIVGRLERADGAPMAGVPVAVVPVRGVDTACGTAAPVAHTDSAGHFAIPARQQRFDRIWIVPGLDVVAPRYDVCVALAETLRTAYHGQVAHADPAVADTVTCVAWEWQRDARVSCTGPADHSIVTGGRWRGRGDSTSGSYRVLLARDPHASATAGHFRETPPHVYVQWLRPLPAGGDARHEIRETVELPLDEGIYALSRVTIEPLDAGWIVRVRGYHRQFMNDVASAEAVYQLDAPGEVRLMRAP